MASFITKQIISSLSHAQWRKKICPEGIYSRYGYNFLRCAPPIHGISIGPTNPSSSHVSRQGYNSHNLYSLLKRKRCQNILVNHISVYAPHVIRLTVKEMTECPLHVVSNKKICYCLYPTRRFATPAR